MMKALLINTLFGLFLLFSGCGGAEENKADSINQEYITVEPVNYLDFKPAKVVAFATVDAFDYPAAFHHNNVDLSKFGDTISVTLNTSQIDLLNEILSGEHRKPYLPDKNGRTVADCFYPRHNVLFLDENDSVIHYLSVCFECGNRKTSKQDLADMDNLAMFFNDVELPVFERPDYYAVHYDSVKASRYESKSVALLRYFRYAFDLEYFKEENRRLLNCGKNISRLYHPKAKGFEYNYCLFNGAQKPEDAIPRLPKDDKLILITVYKFGDKIGTYSDDNETLISLSAKVNNELLGNSNFVGTNMAEIKARFGEPLLTESSVDIYTQGGRSLALAYDNRNEVEWFRYAYLDTNLQLNDSALIKELSTW